MTNSPFIKFLVPVVKESDVFNYGTNRRFVEGMMNNLEEIGLPLGGIELSLKKDGYKLDQVYLLLGHVDSQIFCGQYNFPRFSVVDAEYWMSYKPGLFNKLIKVSIDMSRKGYTQKDADAVLSACRVSEKVKTQVRKVVSKLIDDDDIVLSLGSAINIPFSNKLKIYCCPASVRHSENVGHSKYEEIVKFVKKMGVGEDLSILSTFHKYNLECYYMAFTMGRKGVEQSVSVELANLENKESKALPDVLDFLKEAGLANDTHYPESQNGFHHMKLTFKKGKVIPKLYFSLGYAKRKDPEPRIFQSGRPVDVLRESNLTNSSRVSGFGYAPTQGS